MNHSHKPFLFHTLLVCSVVVLLIKPSIAVGAAADGFKYWTLIADHGVGRVGQVLIWTGSKMIYWGGENSYSPTFAEGGESYDPATQTWAPLSNVNAPPGGPGYLFVWTGHEMIVWQGDAGSSGRYNPATDTWAAISTTNAPTSRNGYNTTAFWTGSEMIFWGGTGDFALVINDGARYNPQTDTWTALPQAGAPSPRIGSAFVWTGTQLIVWGGDDRTGAADYLGNGARYDLAKNAWESVSMVGAPSARSHSSAVWAGNKMIVWGGVDGGGALANGGAYDPITDTWTAIPAGLANAPSARYNAFTAWTGSRVLLFGGYVYDPDFNRLMNGAFYDPQKGVWQPLPIDDQVLSGVDPNGYVWTGTQLIGWGTRAIAYRSYNGAGVIFTVPRLTYLPAVQH